MLGSSLKIIKGVSSLKVLSQLRPNVDDPSGLSIQRKFIVLILTWMVLLGDIFSVHYLWCVPITSSTMIVIFLGYVFFPEGLFQQDSVLKERMTSKGS